MTPPTDTTAAVETMETAQSLLAPNALPSGWRQVGASGSVRWFDCEETGDRVTVGYEPGEGYYAARLDGDQLAGPRPTPDTDPLEHAITYEFQTASLREAEQFALGIMIGAVETFFETVHELERCAFDERHC